MAEYSADKEFISEEVQKAIDDSIRQVFSLKENEPAPANLVYNKDKVNMWTQQLIDYTIRGLNKLNKPFKYCVTAVLQQNTGSNLAKMSVCAGAYQDTNTDGFLNVQNDINDIIVIVNVFAMAI